jgi:hypothetical protein
MLEKYMEWLNSEIEGLKSNSRDNVYLSGKLAEAIRIRQAVCDMDLKNPGVDREIIEKVADKICRRYCRFPEVYPEGEAERMIEERCNKCPLYEVIK